MMNRKAGLLLSLLLLFAASGDVHSGETITTPEIVTESVNLACMAYQPVGVCVWLYCSYSCSIRTSIKIKHYMPDVVVSSYHATGNNPWVEERGLATPTSFAEEGGSNSEGSSVNSEQALRFKNVDAIGNPAITVVSNVLAQSGYYCRSSAIMYFPYFLSTLDPAWRDPIVETPLVARYVYRSVGNGLSTWGSVYPRIGFLHQGHDYKSGAVTAQRAADIVTRKFQPHVYWPLLGRARQGYWPPGEVIEGDANTHKWQQLVPRGLSSTCMVFADTDDTLTVLDPFSSRLNEDEGYVWNLWRPYRCCKRKGQTLLFHTGS